VKLSIHFHIMPRLRMRGVILPLPPVYFHRVLSLLLLSFLPSSQRHMQLILVHYELSGNVHVGTRKAIPSFLLCPLAFVIFNEKTFVRLSCFLRLICAEQQITVILFCCLVFNCPAIDRQHCFLYMSLIPAACKGSCKCHAIFFRPTVFTCF
jgi:hypothetical protein